MTEYNISYVVHQFIIHSQRYNISYHVHQFIIHNQRYNISYHVHQLIIYLYSLDHYIWHFRFQERYRSNSMDSLLVQDLNRAVFKPRHQPNNIHLGTHNDNTFLVFPNRKHKHYKFLSIFI